MNIREDLNSFYQETGWTASRLAREAGVPQPSLWRLKKGEQKGVHSGTLTKLWPFLYGKKRPKRHKEAQ